MRVANEGGGQEGEESPAMGGWVAGTTRQTVRAYTHSSLFALYRRIPPKILQRDVRETKAIPPSVPPRLPPHCSRLSYPCHTCLFACTRAFSASLFFSSISLPPSPSLPPHRLFFYSLILWMYTLIIFSLIAHDIYFAIISKNDTAYKVFNAKALFFYSRAENLNCTEIDRVNDRTISRKRNFVLQ